MRHGQVAGATTAALSLAVLLASASPAHAGDGNRLAYLDRLDPYWPDARAPKLTTPMWIGDADADAGVEAAIVLSIDDMRDAAPYEAFLRPILERLKQVERDAGRPERAGMSIFTCETKLDDPQQAKLLANFLAEGVSLEVHTTDHPCPLFRGGDLALALASVVKSSANLAAIPGNVPVAFRMPCCDSLNTSSPRFYDVVLPCTTIGCGTPDRVEGPRLLLDSSIAMAFTSDDPSLPRELVQEADGSERFLKYLPVDRRFANYITNYPYPYVIGDRCWELPWVVPTDWEAQHRHGVYAEKTLEDLEAALDLTVLKQGLFTLVFHPHGWIRNDQIVALIDHAIVKWGKKVRFLSVRDVKERLGKSLHTFAKPFDTFDPLTRVLDVDDDGLLDWIGGRRMGRWNSGTRRWDEIAFPASLGEQSDIHGIGDYHARFGVIHADGRASVLFRAESSPFNADGTPPPYEWAGSFDGSQWVAEPELLQETDPDRGRRRVATDGALVFTARVASPNSDAAEKFDGGSRLLDLDGDGRCELIVSNRKQNAVFRWDLEAKGWRQTGFRLPTPCTLAADGGVRFVDLDEDGDLDLLVSGVYAETSHGSRELHHESAAWLFEGMSDGWTRPLFDVVEPAGRASPAEAATLPLIARADHTDNGMWVRDRALWWVNEDTDPLPSHVERRGFRELLAPAFPIGTEPPPRSPEASLLSLHLRPGFVAQLVASEPLVMDPISIEWGADGKLWVVEMGDYPGGSDEGEGAGASNGGRARGGGRVKFLEDGNGDGVFDRATTFLDGLSFPTSVLPWRDGVLITAAPDLIFAADRDGDGRAEVHEVRFTGFGEGNPQHRVNGLRLGLDGWVYGANGDSDGEILCTKTGERIDIGGRDWRCDPERGVLEPVTGCTQYGRERDDFGDWFGGNNSVPMWHFLLEERYMLRRALVAWFDPRVQVPAIAGAQPVFPASITRARFNDLDTANHFTSACSPMVYRDELFGPALSSSMFVCEPVHNLVHREVIERAGVTFRSRRAADEQGSEFLASSDPWFRPVQARTGPDGALWVVDMYRDVIEHPEWIPEETQAQLDLRAGADLGRIYRVFPVDRAPRTLRRLDRASDAELAAALRSPNGWTRDTAQRLLVEHGAKAVAPQLLALLGDAAAAPKCRIQALWTLQRLGVLPPAALHGALAARDPALARNALRVAEPALAREPQPDDVVELFARSLAPDAPPALLLQCAFTLGESPQPGAGAALAGILHLARELPPVDRAAIEAAVASSLRRETVAIFLASAEHYGVAIDPFVPGIAQLAAEIVAASGETGVARQLLDEAPGAPRDWATLAPRATTLWEALERNGPVPDALATRLQTLADAARLALRDPARAESAAPAVALLARDGEHRADDLTLLSALLDPQEPPALARAAVARLAQLDDESVPERLLARWRSAGPDLRDAILAALMGRAEWLARLLDAIEQKSVASRDLPLGLRQRLLQSDDDELRARAEQLLATRIDADRAAVVEAFRPALTLGGDRARGQAVFEKKCATCHALRGIGHVVGPDLATMADQSPEALLVAVLDPNRAVESRYVSYSAVTKSGEIATGILAEEGAASVTLRDSGGKEQRILRGELQSLRSSAKSLMTEGLESETTPQEFADLFAFLRDDSRPGKRIAGNEPRPARPMGECGALHLTAAIAEIHGPRLTFEPQFQNLGWWQSGEDLAAWTLEPASAGSYDVLVEFACDASSAGGTLLLEVGAQQLEFAVPATAGWADYREQAIGTLTLAAGAQRLVAKPATPPRSALIDLREIRLTPRPP